MDEDRARYLDNEQMVKRELRDAERVYVNGILQNGLESGNNKPFWKYGKSQKQETFGISALNSLRMRGGICRPRTHRHADEWRQLPPYD